MVVFVVEEAAIDVAAAAMAARRNDTVAEHT